MVNLALIISGRELSKVVEPHLKQEDEGKFRCKTCQKLFKATAFVEKHIANKHPELVKSLDEVRGLLSFIMVSHRIDVVLLPASVLQQLCFRSSSNSAICSSTRHCGKQQSSPSTPGLWHSSTCSVSRGRLRSWRSLLWCQRAISPRRLSASLLQWPLGWRLPALPWQRISRTTR